MKITFLILFLLTVSLHANENSFLSDVLITTEELAAQLNNPQLLLLYIGEREVFDEGHIPNSNFFSTRDILIIDTGSLKHEMPETDSLITVMRRASGEN